MEPGAGVWLVEVSVWLALFLYPFGLAASGQRVPSQHWTRLARGLFTAGGLAFWVHAVSAFVVHYELSHLVALAETARQTEELTGVASGFGLFLNYFFALLWLCEIVWWHSAVDSFRSRSAAVSAAIHGFFLFMIVNGAVVFVPWPRRGLGFAVLGLCGVALWLRFRAGRSRSSSPGSLS